MTTTSRPRSARSKQRLKYVQEYEVGGKVYRYFRKGSTRERLPDDPSSQAFWTAYSDLMALAAPARESASDRYQQGTLGALIEDYKASPAWRGYAEATRANWLQDLDRIKPLMPIQASRIERRHVIRLRNQHLDTPAVADRIVGMIRTLYSFGINDEFPGISVNPASEIKAVYEPESHAAWTMAICKAFEELRPPEGLLTCYMIARYTGMRRADFVRIGPANIVGDGIEWRQSKTNKEMWLPLHPTLAAYLAALPQDRATYAVNAWGKPMRAMYVSQQLAAFVQGTPVEGFTFHGLRHMTGRNLAEAGGTNQEIMASLGHKRIQSSAIYTEGAEQITRAANAAKKLRNFTPRK